VIDLAMGGYAVYVWPAFGITLVVLLVLLWSSLRRLRANEATLAELQRGGGPAAGRDHRKAAGGPSSSSAARGAT
jgi:heme exporter protein D